MDFGPCTTVTNDKIIVFREKKSTLKIKNPSAKEVKKIRVDGCLITEEEKKCDWLAAFDESALLIELKGKDLMQAMRQFENTLNRIKGYYRGKTIMCYAVTTKVPKFTSSCATIKREFFRKHGVKLEVKNTLMTIDI